MAKFSAEINGHEWETGYPLCAGCPELVVGGSCAYEGNGCRFPDKRVLRPVSYARAFLKMCELYCHGQLSTEVAESIGDCIPKEV